MSDIPEHVYYSFKLLKPVIAPYCDHVQVYNRVAVFSILVRLLLRDLERKCCAVCCVTCYAVMFLLMRK